MSIAVLFRKDMDLKPNFMQILTTLITFDILCIVFNLMLFCLPHISTAYFDNVFPYIVPYILPLAQIALTGNLRYISAGSSLDMRKRSKGQYRVFLSIGPPSSHSSTPHFSLQAPFIVH